MYFDKSMQQARRARTTALLLGIVVMLFLIIGCAGSKKTTEEPVDSQIFEQLEPPKEEASQPVQKAAVETAKPEKIPLRFETVYFDFDRSDLHSESARTLQQNAQVMKEYPDVKITIEGHCDERGTVEYNLALGDRRAMTAKQYLVDLGIAPSRITIISYGKERPVDPQRSEEAYAKNRRAAFVIR